MFFRHSRLWSQCDDTFRREHEAVQLDIDEVLPHAGNSDEESNEFFKLDAHVGE